MDLICFSLMGGISDRRIARRPDHQASKQKQLKLIRIIIQFWHTSRTERKTGNVTYDSNIFCIMHKNSRYETPNTNCKDKSININTLNLL